MNKETNKAYVSGIFSALIILFLLSALTVFPNLWDNFGGRLNSFLFKAVPFLVLILSVSIIFCLYQGISGCFYSACNGVNISYWVSFRYLIPPRFFRLIKFYLAVIFIKLVIFVMIFLPVGIISICAFLFYKNGCPLISVMIMCITTVVSLVISVKLYSEIILLFFLSRYIFFENEKGKIKDIITESYCRMKGRSGKIRRLRQSFFLPCVSCIFLVPIPFVLTNYKYEASKTAYDLMKNKCI